MSWLGQSSKDLYAAHGEKLRFLVVGGWNTVFSYAVFAALIYSIGPALRGLSGSGTPWLRIVGDQWYLVAQWLSWILAVPQSTIALKYLVFHSRGHVSAEIGRAFFVYLPLQALSSISLWLLVSKAGMHPLTGQLLTVGVSAVLSYLGHKYFTFKVAKSE